MSCKNSTLLPFNITIYNLFSKLYIPFSTLIKLQLVSHFPSNCKFEEKTFDIFHYYFFVNRSLISILYSSQKFFNRKIIIYLFNELF